MTARMVVLAAIASVPLVAGCGGKGEVVCGGDAPKGDFVPIGQAAGDPAVAVAIATAARVTRSSETDFGADHIGYEGKTGSDGARCFQFVPRYCDVGGGVTMCVTPSLKPQDVTASE